ncbi:MAG: MogA/MoaB family molybdenum cofactor biosynthesis protein [Anaerolineales bacterium]|nr:MogA/MoaB family molybdenum cofactor biosynthesis protein [Anaerolineales bacterium]
MSIEFAILTISDRSSSGTREDRSGPILQQAVIDSGWAVKEVRIVSDEFSEIVDYLRKWSDSGDINVILTTGGTGFSPRDITPEATREVVDRSAPGLAEAMRAGSLKITPHAMLSRAEAGIKNKTLIINLPGSPKGALENFRIIAPVLPHAVQLLENDSGAEETHQRPLAA